LLPSDLKTAEAELLAALQSALASGGSGRWTAELRFSGLRLLPVVLRLATALQEWPGGLALLFPDAGAAALARRDGPGLAALIRTLGDHRRLQAQAMEDGSPLAQLLLVVAPGLAEYEAVESACSAHRGPVVLLNATLEDGAVGIGSVARERRKGFLAGWQSAYTLVPQASSALRRAHPHNWELYRLDADGYRLAAEFDHRPDGEEQEAALLGSEAGGLGGALRSVDRLLEGLQR
jgi:hypothetical protein